MLSTLVRPRTTLDRAIFASVAAMLAMNVVLLTEQLRAAPLIAVAESPANLA
jgi:hypothetical protein